MNSTDQQKFCDLTEKIRFSAETEIILFLVRLNKWASEKFLKDIIMSFLIQDSHKFKWIGNELLSYLNSSSLETTHFGNENLGSMYVHIVHFQF